MKTSPSIENILSRHKVVVFMKGKPGNSPCGFSTRLVQILDHFKVSYEPIDVLSSDDLRSGVKAFSGVKTLPQLFINGAFVGGSDDMRKLYESNQLTDFLQDLDVAFDLGTENDSLEISQVSSAEIISCAKASKAASREHVAPSKAL